MSDEPVAGLLTAIAVAPLCLVRALGPVAFAAPAGSFRNDPRRRVLPNVSMQC
jgi:hypothetical protein